MDTPEVKAFNAELSGLYDNKPPISKAKMSAITKGAIKAIKVYKHVVHSVEKFIQKCKPEYKVPGLYVIDSIVRQSRHQFGQDKDVFAPRFAKNMQQTFANLFRCPPEDKRNIIRVLNLWQKNNVFSSQVIQPLLDMADPNHPLHQEIQQQQNNTANGSSLNISHASDNKVSPGPSSQHTPHMSSPMGDSFQDQPSGPPNMKFNRKLLNDFEYDSEDDQAPAEPPPHSSHSTHTHNTHGHNTHSHTTHSHNTHGHSTHTNQPQPPQPQNTTDAMASILTNPEIMRQLQSLQAQMQMMTGMQIPNLMPMMTDMQQLQNQNQQNSFMNSQQECSKQNDGKDDMAESDIEFVEAGPQVIEIPDANDSRSPSPWPRRRGSKSPRRRRRSRSRTPRRRRDTHRDRDRDKDRDRDRDKDREKSHKEREAEREKQREREKKGLPPIKKENLSVCSCTLWVGHLSKLATPEELWDLFGAAGGVHSIDVVAPRGCAFVVMERRRDAAKALAKLNKHKLHSKEITVAWAPGKGVKEREWREYWEADLGVSYLPWSALHARWLLGALSLDALEDGGLCDEDTLPPWLPPRILPKSMMENMSLLHGMGGVAPGLLPLPPAQPPSITQQMPPELGGGTLQLPAVSAASLTVPVPRMPPPGMAGMPPGMAPGMPPGIRPPALPAGVTGLQGEGGLLRFPGALPPHSMPQPGMVGGFLGGLVGVGVGGLVGGVPLLHMPAHHHPHPQQQQQHNQVSGVGGNSEVAADDDAMELDPEEPSTEPPALLPDQIQALMCKPPPSFNAMEPPPGFNAAEPPPFAQTQDNKQDDDRKNDRDRDRRDRDRERDNRRDRERRGDRDRDRRDRPNDRPRDRERDDRRGDRDRDRGRDRRDRDRDRDRERFSSRESNNRERSREKSPRPAASGDNPEKSLQERLWEMANGKPANRSEEKPREETHENREENKQVHNDGDDNMDMDNDGDSESNVNAPAPGGGWTPAHRPPPPPAHFRPDVRMRGPPRQPMAGPWMEGPPGPFGPRFNGMGPPPFSRPPFDGPPPMFDGPPRFERPPFNRMPFDMNRPPFDGPRPPFDGPRPPFDGPRPPFDGPRPPFDGPRPPFEGGPRPFDPERQYEGPPRFDGPPEYFDRNNRRFEERDQFGGGGWDRRGPEWDDRRRRPREPDDRFRRRRDDRTDARPDRPDARPDRPDARPDRPDGRPERPERVDRPTPDKQHPDKPERAPRKDKDRKSRWGAADPDQPAAPADTQLSSDEQQVAERDNQEGASSEERHEVPQDEPTAEHEVRSEPSEERGEPEPSDVHDTRLHDTIEDVQETQRNESHEEEHEPSRDTECEAQRDSPQEACDARPEPAAAESHVQPDSQPEVHHDMQPEPSPEVQSPHAKPAHSPDTDHQPERSPSPPVAEAEDAESAECEEGEGGA